MVGDDVGSDEVERRRVVRRGVGGLDAGPRSPSSLAMRRLRLAVSAPAAHSVLISAWARCGDETNRPIATNAVLKRQAVGPRIEQG